MGVGSFFFGSAPSTSVSKETVRSDQQIESLEGILGELSNKGTSVDSFEGDLSPGLHRTQNLSLAAMEEAALKGGQDPVAMAADEELLKFIKGNNNTDFEEFYRTNIRDPLTRDFKENIQPDIARNFGGSSFFSSERAKADRFSIEDLNRVLTENRGKLAYDDRNRNLDRALQAIGLSGSIRSDRNNAFATLFNAGETARLAGVGDIEREFGRFESDRGQRSTQIKELLAAINTPITENIATTSGGSSGLLSGLF